MQDRHLLGAGARSGDHPDPPRRDDVGEAEREPVEDGGAGAGAHDEAAEAVGAALEGDLVLDGDAVAEQEHVQARPEGLVGLERRVLAGHRDHRNVAAHAGEGARPPEAGGRGAVRRRRAVQDRLGRGEAVPGGAPAARRSPGRRARPRRSRDRRAPNDAASSRLAGVPMKQKARSTPSTPSAARTAAIILALSAQRPATDANLGHAETTRPSGPASRGSACAPRASSSVSAARSVAARPPSTSTAPGRRWMNGDAWAIA